MADSASGSLKRSSPSIRDDRYAVRMRGIRKQFPGVVACDRADLAVRVGTVHGLIGENGAGKTSLVSVLAGVYLPDAGELWVDGEHRRFRCPADSIAAGVAMVHQEFRLVPTLTVAENVVLGAAPRILRTAEIERSVADLADSYALAVDARSPVWQLSMGERQRVEILKALWSDARVMILDEPTAVLTPAEADELAKTLRAMVDRGRSVIYISHKLDEVISCCDEATVLRRGRTTAVIEDLSSVDRAKLAELMVGDSISGGVQRPPAARPAGVRLSVRGLSALGDRGLEALRGRVFGIARRRDPRNRRGFRQRPDGTGRDDQRTALTHRRAGIAGR